MAGSVLRGIRKRSNSAGQPRYQVRYLLRDPDSPSGWVETSSTFATLREARAFKADRDREVAISARRFGHVPLDEVSRKDVQQCLTVGPWAKVATIRLLRSILEMAREDGRIHINSPKSSSTR